MPRSVNQKVLILGLARTSCTHALNTVTNTCRLSRRPSMPSRSKRPMAEGKPQASNASLSIPYRKLDEHCLLVIQRAAVFFGKTGQIRRTRPSYVFSSSDAACADREHATNFMFSCHICCADENVAHRSIDHNNHISLCHFSLGPRLLPLPSRRQLSSRAQDFRDTDADDIENTARRHERSGGR